jgi:two-component system OmpR family sensor kinase
MGVLVDDLLLLARLDQGRPLDLGSTNLAALVRDAVADAKAVEPSRPLTLDAPERVMVNGDEDRLRQVIANLLGNVRIHTASGTAARVRVSAEGGYAVLEVEDDGPGLGTEPARVFERFYRADPARSRASGGVGLGLSIVSSVVEAHGGRATARRAPSGGAQLRIELPLVETDSATAPDTADRSSQFA